MTPAIIVQPFTQFGWTIPLIGEGTKGDPNSLESGTSTQNTTTGAISISLLQAGAIDFTDPGDGLFWVWPVVDILGETGVEYSDLVMMSAHLTMGTNFGASDDAWAAIGFCNEATLNSGTVDGDLWGMVATAAKRTARAGLISDGSDNVTDDATDAGDFPFLMGTLNRNGAGTIDRFTSLLDANGDIIASASARNSGGNTPAGAMLCFVAAGRASAAAGVVSTVITPRFYVCPAPTSGRNP